MCDWREASWPRCHAPLLASPHDLESLLVELHVRMGLVEDSLNDCHHGTTQIVVSSFSVSQLFLWIMDIELGVFRSFSSRRKEGT